MAEARVSARDRPVLAEERLDEAAPLAADRFTRTRLPERRMVRITGRGAERYLGGAERHTGRPERHTGRPERDTGGPERHVPASGVRRRPPQRRHERPGFRPDRAALWAFLLGALLILIAASSSHAVTGARHPVTGARPPASAVNRRPPAPLTGARHGA